MGTGSGTGANVGGVEPDLVGHDERFGLVALGVVQRAGIGRLLGVAGRQRGVAEGTELFGGPTGRPVDPGGVGHHDLDLVGRTGSNRKGGGGGSDPALETPVVGVVPPVSDPPVSAPVSPPSSPPVVPVSDALLAASLWTSRSSSPTPCCRSRNPITRAMPITTAPRTAAPPAELPKPDPEECRGALMVGGLLTRAGEVPRAVRHERSPFVPRIFLAGVPQCKDPPPPGGSAPSSEPGPTGHRCDEAPARVGPEPSPGHPVIAGSSRVDRCPERGIARSGTGRRIPIGLGVSPFVTPSAYPRVLMDCTRDNAVRSRRVLRSLSYPSRDGHTNLTGAQMQSLRSSVPCEGSEHRRSVDCEVGPHRLAADQGPGWTSAMSNSTPVAFTVPTVRPVWVTSPSAAKMLVISTCEVIVPVRVAAKTRKPSWPSKRPPHGQ